MLDSRRGNNDTRHPERPTLPEYTKQTPEQLRKLPWKREPTCYVRVANRYSSSTSTLRCHRFRFRLKLKSSIQIRFSASSTTLFTEAKTATSFECAVALEEGNGCLCRSSLSIKVRGRRHALIENQTDRRWQVWVNILSLFQTHEPMRGFVRAERRDSIVVTNNKHKQGNDNSMSRLLWIYF